MKRGSVVAGVDIGGTNTKIGLVNETGTILGRKTISTTDYPLVADFITAIYEAIEVLINEVANYDLLAIGIGAPNANYHKGTIELAPNLRWKGIIPFASMMKEKSGRPVTITNDANAAAVGEMTFGGAKGMNDFIIITLGTGLGSGIVTGGEVLYGSTGFAGELGHTLMVPGGRKCGCGKKGCLETYVSATGIVRTVISLLEESTTDSSLRETDKAEITSEMIAIAAEQGDEIALEAFRFTAEKLGIALVNAIVFSSPEAIFLFGGLAKAGRLITEPVIAYVDTHVQPIFRGSYKILQSALPEADAAILGSAALAWKRINI